MIALWQKAVSEENASLMALELAQLSASHSKGQGKQWWNISLCCTNEINYLCGLKERLGLKMRGKWKRV